MLVETLILDGLEGLVDVGFFHRANRDILTVDILAAGQYGDDIAVGVLDGRRLILVLQLLGDDRTRCGNIADQHAAAQTAECKTDYHENQDSQNEAPSHCLADNTRQG